MKTEVLQTCKRENNGPLVLLSYAAAVSSNNRVTNATCPAMLPFGNHLTCPFRIMFMISMP